MMNTWVLETCGELEEIYTKKTVRQVGYLQEFKSCKIRLFLNHKYAVLYNEKNLPSLIKIAIFTFSLVYIRHRESQMPSYCVSKG
jgi:hypothetical protein